MNAIDVARQVVKSGTAYIYRRQEDGSYQIHPTLLANLNLPGWSLLDLISAQCVMDVYETVSDQYKANFETFSLDYMIRFSFQAAA